MHLYAFVPSGSLLQALRLELILTLLLMFVVSSVATDIRAVGQAAAIAIGGYVALAATFAGPLSRYLCEPGALVRSRTPRRHLNRPLGVLGRSSVWNRARHSPIPARAGRESTQAL